MKSAETAVSHEEDVEQGKLIMYKHFVLPKRSTRSSRIIKPNKRLLEMGGITSTTSNSSSKSSSSKKSVNSNEISAKTTTKPTKNYFGLGDLSDETAASSTSSITLGLSLGKDHFPIFGSMKQNSSSFVLRKSRLQLQTDNSGSTFAQKSTLLPASTSSISSSAMSSAANAVTFGSSLSSPGKLRGAESVLHGILNNQRFPAYFSFSHGMCRLRYTCQYQGSSAGTQVWSDCL